MKKKKKKYKKIEKKNSSRGKILLLDKYNKY